MKRKTRTIGVLLAGLLASAGATGCQTMSNTDKGVLTGGALGATAGALIGGTKGKAGAGALIGGALGAVGGGLTGNAIDSSERKMATANAAPALTLEKIAELTASGSSDDLIIGQIYSTGSVYHLSADQIIWLQNQGVREPVIRVMQQTASRPVRRVYTQVPVQPVYVVPAPPPPPPPVGIGVGLTIRGRR